MGHRYGHKLSELANCMTWKTNFPTTSPLQPQDILIHRENPQKTLVRLIAGHTSTLEASNLFKLTGNSSMAAAMTHLIYSQIYDCTNLSLNRQSPIQTTSNLTISPHLPPLYSKTRDCRLSFNLFASSGNVDIGISSGNNDIEISSGNGDIGIGSGGGTGGSGGGDRSSGGGDEGSEDGKDTFGPLRMILNGWRSRVQADPQFPFKVLMEELVGVTACVLGDMASRPNFGLNELDFVFSTLVVGSILNFVLMYILAPTAGASASSGLPSIFANCPTSHMFEPGSFTLFNRLGTLVYKGVLFAAVGFAAGLVGTAISNGLIAMRKKMDPEFETPNKPPPTLLNAGTWALHMGLSSNFRYQTLNGVEFVLAKGVPPLVFKVSVVILRCLNNVLGGVSFVLLARMTGSQKGGKVEADDTVEEVKEKLVGNSSDSK